MSRTVTAAAIGAAVLAAHAAVNARLLRTPPRHAGAVTSVSVLVPARDEAARIGPCLTALLAQDVAEILVIDDGSTDGTADVVRAVSAGDDRVLVLEGAPLPAGWLGKPHACQQLADAARGDVLAFVDADVVLAADGLARAVTLLDASGLDLISPYPRQVTESVAERLVQPLLQWSWLTFLPLRLAERWAAPRLTAANGQLLVCGAAAYARVGGHAAVRGNVVEDVALARAFKRHGLAATVVDGTDIATCRMYAGLADLRDGYTKSLWAAFGSRAGAAGAMALLGWLYVVPAAGAAVGVVRRDVRLGLTGLAGYGAGVAGRVVAAQRTGGRATDALAHPASIAALVWLTARSWRHKRAGRLVWRGRRIP